MLLLALFEDVKALRAHLARDSRRSRRCSVVELPTRGRPVPGKPNLSAPASLLGGKPNVASVWMHEIPTVAEVKRLLGDVLDDVSSECARNGNRYRHKYGVNI